MLRAQSEPQEKSHLANCIQYSVDAWCFEVPAGGISPSLSPEEVARRELSEEIGGTAADLRYEAMRMARKGEITDGPSALALLWCETLLRL